VRLAREALKLEQPAGHQGRCGGAITGEARNHLVETIGALTAQQWRSMAQNVQEASGSQGGSQSRSNFIATLVATEHNRTAPKDAVLTTPASKISSRLAPAA